MRTYACLLHTCPATLSEFHPDHQSQRRLHFPTRGHVRCPSTPLPLHSLTLACSYFVTELLGTDLHRLLTSRPLEKQFIQYFLYQILVSA